MLVCVFFVLCVRACACSCVREIFCMYVSMNVRCGCVIVCVCMDASRYMPVMMIDEWIGWCIVCNCPVARSTPILASASQLNAALKREPSSSDILFVGLHANIVEQNFARERQVVL